MNTLKKFSVETHKGWASFQAWIKKWNKIMAVIFSALGITLLLSAVIVNALEVHEENQKRLNVRIQNENLPQVCQVDPSRACFVYCNDGSSTGISEELNYYWEENAHCQSVGINIEISSTINFPKFTIPKDWLNGKFKLKELQIDVENVFEICENAFTGAVFEWMQKLVLNNFHLYSIDTAILQNFFFEHHFKHLTITKNLSTEELAIATVELHTETVSYMENKEKYQVEGAIQLSDPTKRSANVNGVLIISLTIVGCMLSFSLGLFIRYNFLNRKKFSNKMNRSRTIFLIENNESV